MYPDGLNKHHSVGLVLSEAKLFTPMYRWSSYIIWFSYLHLCITGPVTPLFGLVIYTYVSLLP